MLDIHVGRSTPHSGSASSVGLSPAAELHQRAVVALQHRLVVGEGVEGVAAVVGAHAAGADAAERKLLHWRTETGQVTRRRQREQSAEEGMMAWLCLLDGM